MQISRPSSLDVFENSLQQKPVCRGGECLQWLNGTLANSLQVAKTLLEESVSTRMRQFKENSYSPTFIANYFASAEARELVLAVELIENRIREANSNDRFRARA